MQIFGIEVRQRARAAMTGAAIYFALAAFTPWFIGFNEIYFLFLPLLPVLTLSLSTWLVLHNYDRFILTRKMIVLPIAPATLLMVLHMEEPELASYLFLCGGLYAVLFLLIVALSFKLSFARVDYIHAFLFGTILLLPLAFSRNWLVFLASVWMSSALMQVMLGLIIERAFFRLYHK